MENWQLCESECLEYLKNNFSNTTFNFEAEGGSDSTKSDILLTKNGIATFFIESKMKKAQCGQFVVIAGKDNHFVYSRNNKYDENLQSSVIIQKMDEKFSTLQNPGTSGIDLNLDTQYYYDWIFNFYRAKGVKYFIVEKEVGKNKLTSDNFVIFPIENFNKYFDASAKYRVKKSGSNHPPKSAISEIENTLKKNSISFSNLNFIGKNLFVTISNKTQKFQLSGENYDYQFNPQQNGTFEIRRLSNTANANVIFSISLKKEQDENDLLKFKSEFSL